MNRDKMIVRVLEVKDRAVKQGHKPVALALSGGDMLKMACTHLHGLTLFKLSELKRGHLAIFESIDDELKPINLAGGGR